MLILAIEGALARCSAAILRDGTVLAAGRHDAPRGHPAILPPLVQQVFAEAGLRPVALDAVAVGVGPGGFTGLRTAIALAEGVSQALGKPLIGVTTGEALVAELPEALRGTNPVWSVLEQRQGRVIVEIFRPAATMPEPPVILPIEALPDPGGAVFLVGDAAADVAMVLGRRGIAATAQLPALPSAKALGRVATRRSAGFLPPRHAAPLYAEQPATTKPNTAL